MHQITKERVRLIRAMHKAGMTVVADAIRADANSHFLSFSLDDQTRVSYACKPEDKYESTRRVKTSLGRYLRRKYTTLVDPISDSALAAYVANVFGFLVPASAFIRIVQGGELVGAYKRAYGDESCMTGDNAGDLVSLYADNPDRVSLVLYENGCKARALLWTTDSGTKVLDRIYPGDGYHVNALCEWASQNGYTYRVRQSAGYLKLSDGKKYTVTLENTTDTWPYADTFRYGKDVRKGVVLTNESYGWEWELSCLNGERSYGDDVCCHCDEITRDPVYEGDTVWCQSCHDVNFVYCESCCRSYPSDNVGYDDVTGMSLCNDCLDRDSPPTPHTATCPLCSPTSNERAAEAEEEGAESQEEEEECEEVTPSAEEETKLCTETYSATFSIPNEQNTPRNEVSSEVQ